MNINKELAVSALSNMKGDDTFRARARFKNLTPDQMNEQFGQSGKTCQQILDGHIAYDQKIDEAIAWVKQQPD